MPDLAAERNTLRAILGKPGPLVYLDIKPPGLLTDQERQWLEARLSAVESESRRQQKTPADS